MLTALGVEQCLEILYKECSYIILEYWVKNKKYKNIIKKYTNALIANFNIYLS